jgi:uncharacterized membrane protein YdfJ with MMPL/SSD domain
LGECASSGECAAGALAIGVLIDAIAVRSLLVPALVVLFGRLGMWPRSVISGSQASGGPAVSPAVPRPMPGTPTQHCNPAATPCATLRSTAQ